MLSLPLNLKGRNGIGVHPTISTQRQTTLIDERLHVSTTEPEDLCDVIYGV